MRLLRATLLAAVVAAAALPASAPADAGCADADLPIAPATAASDDASVFCLVNQERTARGLPAVAPNLVLAATATAHTQFMLVTELFDHEGIGDGDPGTRATGAGYSWGALDENIATGQDTPRDVMTAWMQSADHCQNILDPGVTQLGVGALPGYAGAGYTYGGTWTELFGRPRSADSSSTDGGPAAGCPYATLSPAGAAVPLAAPVAPVAAGPPPAPRQATAAVTAPAVRVKTRLSGRRVTLSGSVTPAVAGRKVAARIRCGMRFTARRTVRTRRGGTFSLTLTVPRGHAHATAELVAGGAKVAAQLRLRRGGRGARRT